MSKKLFTIAALICIISMSLFTAVQADEETQYFVGQDSSIIVLEPGQALDVSSYLFEFTEQMVEGTEVTLSAQSPELTINGKSILAEEEGIFNMTAQYGEESMEIHAVSGAVVFEDDFSSGLSDQYRVVEGSNVYVEDGFLYVGPSCRVLLPETLDILGNYIIEVDATLLNPTDYARWVSVMYRVQNEDYPYYQMCIRSTATASNGVEFAERTTQNAWNVMNTASYSESISPDKIYNFRVEANGPIVSQYINQTLTQTVNNANVWTAGGIGLQANGSTMKVDSVKVTAVQEVYEVTYGYAEASTPLKNNYSSSALAVKPDTAEDIESYAVLDESERPSSVMVEVNSDLSVSTLTGNAIGSIEQLLAALDNKLIPIFRTDDTDTAVALAQKLDDINFPDAYILSNSEAILAAKETNFNFYGLLDMSGDTDEITEDKLAEIRSSVNSSKCKTVLLPEAYAEKEYIQFLQKGTISIWLDSEVTDITAACRLISCGANGYATNNPDNLTAAAELFSDDAMLRKTLIIGHRGIPNIAPENTLEGAVKAYENGADIVEVDLYVTTDNELVIMHDGDISRTTNGTGNIESYTLAQLKEFYANDQFPNNPEYAECRIPTMREFFEEFKDTDMGFFIEIKTTKASCLTLLKELLDEYADYNMASRCTVISFHMSQLQNSIREMPGVSASFLCGGLITDDTVYTSLHGVANQLLPDNVSFSTSYYNVGADSIEALALRGITTWPWTVDGTADYYNFIKSNAGGITTDNCSISKNFAHTLNVPSQSITLGLNQTAAAQGSLTTYSRETLELPEGTELVLISGEDVISVDGLNITGLKEGTASYMIKSSFTNRGGLNYTLYSQPVTVTVDASAPAPTEQPSAAPGTQPEETADTSAVPYIVGACVLVVIIAAVIIIMTVNKRKNNNGGNDTKQN